MFKRFLLLSLVAFLLIQCENNTKTEQTKDQIEQSKESKTEDSNTSEITCPECGHTKLETLPTEVCAIKYTCENCKAELTPIDGDCCVYCSYGTHKCPSMQD